MARYRITAPVLHVTGTIAGVAFVESVGETDSTRATVYFRRHGYKVEDLAVQATPEPSTVDAESSSTPAAPAQPDTKPARTKTTGGTK